MCVIFGHIHFRLYLTYNQCYTYLDREHGDLLRMVNVVPYTQRISVLCNNNITLGYPLQMHNKTFTVKMYSISNTVLKASFCSQSHPKLSSLEIRNFVRVTVTSGHEILISWMNKTKCGGIKELQRGECPSTIGDLLCLHFLFFLCVECFSLLRNNYLFLCVLPFSLEFILELGPCTRLQG